ncbi:hypothetical protein D3C71_1161580 [compost metagenome]
MTASNDHAVALAEEVVEDPGIFLGLLLLRFCTSAGREVDAVITGVEEVVEHHRAATVGEFDTVTVVGVVGLVHGIGQHHVLVFQVHDAVVGGVEYREAAVEDVRHIAQGDQRRTHLTVCILDVHALGHRAFDLGLGQHAIVHVAGVAAGQVERQRLATLVDNVGLAFPAIAVDGALADDADVLECLMLVRVARQGINQRGWAHGGAVGVLDVTVTRVVLGSLGAEQCRPLGDLKGHVALEVERAALVRTGRQQHLAARGAGIDGVLDRDGVQRAAVAPGTVLFHIEQRRHGGGALDHRRAVGRLLAVTAHRAHREAIFGVGLEAKRGEAVDGDAVMEVSGILLVEPIDVRPGRRHPGIVGVSATQQLAIGVHVVIGDIGVLCRLLPHQDNLLVIIRQGGHLDLDGRLQRPQRQTAAHGQGSKD